MSKYSYFNGVINLYHAIFYAFTFYQKNLPMIWPCLLFFFCNLTMSIFLLSFWHVLPASLFTQINIQQSISFRATISTLSQIFLALNSFHRSNMVLRPRWWNCKIKSLRYVVAERSIYSEIELGRWSIFLLLIDLEFFCCLWIEYERLRSIKRRRSWTIVYVDHGPFLKFLIRFMFFSKLYLVQFIYYNFVLYTWQNLIHQATCALIYKG